MPQQQIDTSAKHLDVLAGPIYILKAKDRKRPTLSTRDFGLALAEFVAMRENNRDPELHCVS